jgi:hypothetical protein
MEFRTPIRRWSLVHALVEFGTRIGGVWYTYRWSLVHISEEFFVRISLYYIDLIELSTGPRIIRIIRIIRMSLYFFNKKEEDKSDAAEPF